MDAKEKAFELAKEVRLRAYAPYSQYLVGSCFKLAGRDEYISGCNVENASFGATICAERNALVASVAKYGKKTELEFAVVVTKDDPPAPPCALCLQVLAEFVGPDFPIYLGTPEKIVKKYLLKELLPISFTKFASNKSE